jgi:hypothetical protein
MPQSHQDQHGTKDQNSQHHDYPETLLNRREVRIEPAPPSSPQFYPSHQPDFVLTSSLHIERHTSSASPSLMLEGNSELELSTELSPASSFPQASRVQYSSPAQLPPQAHHQSHARSVHALPSQHADTWASCLPFSSSYHAGPPAVPIDLTTPMYADDPRLASENHLTRTVSAPAELSAPHHPHTSSQPQHLLSSDPNYFTPATSSLPHHRLQYGTIAHHPHISSTIHSTSGTPRLRPSTTPQLNASSNLSIGTLSISEANNAMQALHWLTCDGCGANPLKGNRWKCITCTDFDLCGNCHSANIHSHHRFEIIHAQCEMHASYGNGCSARTEAINET